MAEFNPAQCEQDLTTCAKEGHDFCHDDQSVGKLTTVKLKAFVSYTSLGVRSNAKKQEFYMKRCWL